MKQNYMKHIGAMALGILMLSACQDNDWDDHYGIDNSNTATMSVMQTLEANTDYSEFCKVIKEQHLDTLLNSDQSFTVWAPTNNAMAAFVSDGNDVEHFLQNHINRYVYSAADLTDTINVRIKMLNGKFQNFAKGGEGLTFSDIALTGNDYAATNGLIHTLSKVAPFYLNIYESIKENVGKTDSLSHYLQSFDEYTFDKSNSTATGKNELGQLVYDSVFVYSNPWMKKYGDLYKEDSIYTVIVPDNECWKAAYAETSKYFRTFGTLVDAKESTLKVPTRTYEVDDQLADSLTRAYAIQNMASNLVFRGKTDFSAAPGDSLVATSGNVFHHPIDLLAGANAETVSNGTIWHASQWNYQPEDCFLKEIVVEAEDTKNRTDAYANVFSRSASSTQYADSVSGQKFIEVTAATTSSRTQPMVQFTIPNTLAATYDVYVVFAPSEAYVEDATADSTRVRFYLNYVHEDGKMKEDAVINGTITKGKGMTRMFVKRITLPYANYSASRFTGSQQQDPDCVRLRVQANVSASETTKLTRTMRIDCIEFEPVIE